MAFSVEGAELGALRYGARKAGADTFLEYGSFELGEDRHHLEHRLAGGRRGVDALLVQVQVDLEGVNLSQKGDLSLP
jgi:hypothetical protein